MSRIAKFRKKAQLTQRELADQLKMSERSVAFWEQGRRHPKAKTLRKIARVLGCKFEDLLADLA